jgi:pimeloyl-ACP methyl ester carboxylesterase
VIDRELLAIPLPASGRLDIYSGVARLAGTLWATLWRDRARRPKTVLLFVHPASNFMGHYALKPLADMGVAAAGFATRYVGNDSSLLMENCVLDIGAAVRYLRDMGFEKVVLVGNSGGGGLASLYQSQAESPSLTATPAGDPPDLTQADLPPVDGLILAMAHPGRALVYTEWLDPAIRNEHDPFNRDPELDLFNPVNGPPFTEEFLGRYRAAQIERNRRITAWVRAELDASGARGLVDMPFLVHGAAADPRFVDLAVDPSDRKPETLWGSPWTANFSPSTLGRYTSLRSWLSQWSYDDSESNAPRHLPRVTVPVQVIYGTADAAAFPSHAVTMYESVRHAKKELIAIEGAHHYFLEQPELIAVMCRHMLRWCDSVL